MKRLWSAKQTTSRRYVGPLCRKLNPHPGSIRYQQVSELPGTVSPHRPACPGNFSSTEVAELSAGSPVATNLHIQNCGSYANVPVHARLDIIYEEEPHHLGIIDEEGPHLGIIDEEEPHLIDPNDEGDFYGLDSYGTNHSLRASREDLDVGFSPSHPPGISTQSALILTPIPGPELLPPESKPYEKATLPGTFLVSDHQCQRISSNPQQFSTAWTQIAISTCNHLVPSPRYHSSIGVQCQEEL